MHVMSITYKREKTWSILIQPWVKNSVIMCLCLFRNCSQCLSCLLISLQLERDLGTPAHTGTFQSWMRFLIYIMLSWCCYSWHNTCSCCDRRFVSVFQAELLVNDVFPQRIMALENLHQVINHSIINLTLAAILVSQLVIYSIMHMLILVL